MPAAMMKLSMHMSYGSQGWVESLWLDGDSYEAQEPIAKNLVAWRRLLLGNGVLVEWAKLSRTDIKRDSYAIQSQPVGTTFVDEEDTQLRPNDAETALQMRFQTATGKFANTIIRGLADSLVYDKKLTEIVGNITIAAGTAAPGAGLTRLQALEGYLAQLGKTTFFARKVIVDGTYIKEDWAKVFYRGIRNRKTGRPFGQTRGRAAASA